MENQNPIDDLFQTVGEPFEMEPASQVWDSLDNHLEKRQNESLRKKFLFFKRISISLGIIICFLLAWILIGPNKNSPGENMTEKIAVHSEKNKVRNNLVSPVENPPDKKELSNRN